MAPSATVKLDGDNVTPGSSSSVTVTSSPSRVAPTYSGALPESTECATVSVSSMASSSSTAVTVTVCATFHDDVENVNATNVNPLATRTSPPLATPTVTSAVGMTLSSTV